MPNEQLPLFPSPGAKAKLREPESRVTEPMAAASPLTASSSLAAGIGAFRGHMQQKGWSPHTYSWENKERKQADKTD